jgi:ferric-dicitrate binding protein FerR (iron transport regulator)
MTPERFQELMDAYVDQALAPTDQKEVEQHLLSSPSACKEFWRHVEFHAQVRELMLQADGGKKLPAIQSEQRASYTQWIWLAAAAVVMLVVAWWFVGEKKGVTVAKVMSVQGSVMAQNQSVRVNDEISTEATVETGKDGEVKLAYGEGMAEVVLGKNSTLLTAKSEKALRLEKGQLAVVVSKQPKDKTFIVTTPQAEMRVIGTKFKVLANEKSTQLKVNEGEVSMQGSSGSAVAVKAGFMAIAATGVPINPVPVDSSQELPEGVIFFRDFETIFPGEESKNEIVRLKEPQGEVTALVSIPAESQTQTFRPDVTLKLSRAYSKAQRETPLYIIPKGMEIRLRIRSEYPGKISLVQRPTHPLFRMEHFYADGFNVDNEWREVVVRSSDVQPNMKEGQSRDFVPGVEIYSFSMYGFGTGKLFLDSFTVVSTRNNSSY